MFGFFFAEGPITCFEEAAAQVDLEKFGRFHRGMVRRYTPRSRFLSNEVLLSAYHQSADSEPVQQH